MKADVVRTIIMAAFPWLGCTGTVEPTTLHGASGETRPGDSRTSPPRAAGDPMAAPLPSGEDLRTLRNPMDGVGGGLALRGLTRAEYDNTVAALLADTTAPARQWGVEVKGENGFLEPRPISGKEVAEYMEAAGTLADRLKANLGKMLGCDPGQMGEDACARTFVVAFGRKAFRRPLYAEEIADYVGLWSSARKTNQLAFDDSIALVVEAMLQSPSFMYHWELGPRPPRREGDGTVRLTSYEVAARLSYFLTQSPPDDLLGASADSGRILDPAEMKAQAQRLMGTSKARELFQDYVAQLLNVYDLASSDDPVLQAMDRARRAFVDKAIWTGKGSSRELLLDSGFFVNATLAPLYGLAGVKGDAMVATPMDPSRRFGLLTHADFLAKTGKGNDSLPPRRGRAIWENLLCGEIPAGLPPVPPELTRDPADTTREHFQKKVEPIACASACHKILDYAGYAFENYGGPSWRDRDAATGKPIDSTGSLQLPFGTTVSYQGARDFVEGLAASDELPQCLSRQMLRLAIGRDETVADAVGLKAAFETFSAAGQDLKALAIAVVAARGFSYRRLNAGEVAQ